MQTKSAVVGPRGFQDGRREYKPEDLQTVQQFEEKANEAIMVLEGNTDVLCALREYYEALTKNQAFTLQTSCAEAVTSFTTQVNDALYDTKMQLARAKLLLRITSDRKSLVSLAHEGCSILLDVIYYRKVLTRPSDLTASPDPTNGENGDIDRACAKGSNRYAHHHRGYPDLSSSDVCLGKASPRGPAPLLMITDFFQH